MSLNEYPVAVNYKDSDYSFDVLFLNPKKAVIMKFHYGLDNHMRNVGDIVTTFNDPYDLNTWKNLGLLETRRYVELLKAESQRIIDERKLLLQDLHNV